MNAPSSQPEGQNSPRILVVDDDVMVREVVVESIKAIGHEVEVCGDAGVALEQAKEKGYELIVTDMRLPGMDGLTLLKRLRATRQDTDVIVITGYGSVENAVECMKAGALDYLIKPFTVDQIQVAVRKALDHRDLVRRAKEREFYRALSYVDSLTGVYNRRHFDEALEAEIQKAAIHNGTVLLFMIDIDDFKIYNDHNGHQKGDDVLATIGRTLHSVCRASDIVTRYGGEEFAIIFPGAGKEHAGELSTRVMQGVGECCFEGEESLPQGCLTISIGAASYPDDADNSRDLIRFSDMALYKAKEAGKNRIELYSGV